MAIFVQQGLGDVVLALGAIKRIRDRFGGQVVLVVKSELERQLIEIVFPDLANSTLVASTFGGHPIVRWGRIGVALRREKISHIVGLHLRNTRSARFVVRLAGAPHVEFNPFEMDEGRHKIAHYSAMADRMTGEAAPIVPFHLDEIPGRSPVSKRRNVVLAPGSGALEAHKRWPQARYAELIDILYMHDASTPFVLLGAPAERSLLESIAQSVRMTGANVQILAAPTLRDSLAALGNARVVIGGCSGSLHLASLVDVPIIGLYGPTNPGWTGPVASVVRIVRSDFACAPCYTVDFIKGCGNAQCMLAVSARDVQAALEDMEREPSGSNLPWYPLSRLRTATAKVDQRRAV